MAKDSQLLMARDGRYLMDSMQRLSDLDAIRRLAAHDGSLYTSDIDVKQKIAHRMGWTDLAEKAPQRIPLIRTLAKTLTEEGAKDIVLLGMGGSSLAAHVMSEIIGSAPGMPGLHASVAGSRL
jgi:transaldolase/glucose-6-phosphate isomerase